MITTQHTGFQIEILCKFLCTKEKSTHHTPKYTAYKFYQSEIEIHTVKSVILFADLSFALNTFYKIWPNGWLIPYGVMLSKVVKE